MALSEAKSRILQPRENGSSARDGFFNAFFDAAGRKRGYSLLDVRKELQAAGEDFTKDDFFAPFVHDKYPQIVCSNESTNYNITLLRDALDILHELGEVVPVGDFTRRHDGESVINEAIKRGVVKEMFGSKYWSKHLDDMKELWNAIPERDRQGINFSELLAQAEALSGPEFEITPSLRKEHLFAANDKGFTPLDDSRTWKKFDQIISTLGANGEQLTKADLLRKNRSGKTYLEAAINAGQQDKVLDLLEHQNDKITADDVKEHNIGSLFATNNKDFYYAAIAGNAAKVKAALKLGLVDIEYKRTTDEGTALWQAAQRGHAEVVEALIDAGADVVFEKGRFTVLNIAAYRGNKQTVEKVIAGLEKRFADKPQELLEALTKPDSDRDTPARNAQRNKSDIAPVIEAAVSRAQLKMVNQDDPDVTKAFPDGNTFLNVAVRAGDAALAERTVAKLQEIHKDQPQKLYDAVTQKGTDGRSPEDAARNAGKTEIADRIKDIAAEARVRTDFVEAADNGNLALVQKYIELKAVDLDVTHYDNKWTALMSAVKNNHEPVVDALLAAGANPDARSQPRQNVSSLYLCASRNRESIAIKIIAALKEKYKDDPLSLFKALTHKSNGDDRSTYQEAKRNGNDKIAALVDAEVAALIPTVATWDEKTLQDTDARRALKEHGKIRALTETIDTRPHKRIAIVGAGFSGTVTAIHLLNNAREPLEVMLIEKSDKRRSGGIAYSAETASEELLTNIPISRMSAFDDRPNDLLEWLGRADRKDWPERYQRTRFEANQSVPRVLYQKYLETRLQEAIDRNETSLIKKLNGEVVDVIDTPEKATVVFKDGTAYDANQAILATGYTTPKEAKFTAKIKETGRYIADQYSAEGQELRKSIGKDDTVLVVGSGLSAYDAIVSLKQQGHEGKIIVTSRGGHTHPPYPNRGIEDAFRIDRPRFMEATTVPELISGLRKYFWERTALEGHSTERVIEAYQRYISELIKKFPSDTVRQLLRDHSSLIATLRVGVSSEIARIVEDAKISGQVQIMPASLHEMQPTESGVKVRYTPSGSSHDETMDVGHVISCLGRDTIKDDLWRNLTARGQTQSHFTGHGIQVGAQGQVVDSLNKESSTVIAVGPMRGGDSLERNGLIGPPAFAVPGIRRQMQAAAELALQRISKQSEVSHTPVEAKTESVADKVVMRDRTGRMHCEIGFGADSKPNEMKVFVGGGQGTLTEVHTRGDDDGTIKVTRYHDGEAQSPVTKRVGEPGFMSWDDVLASQQQVGAGRAANG